jgi:hypothetical protein
MLRQFEKYLNKKFGKEFKTTLQQAKLEAEKNRIQREKEIGQMKDTQRKVLRDIIKTQDILYCNNLPLHDSKVKCTNIIKYGKENNTCGKEFDALETLFFAFYPPHPQGISKEDVLQSIYNNNFKVVHRCSCGFPFALCNRRG